MIPLFKVPMSEDLDESLLKTIHSGFVGQGPKVEEFEKALCKRFDSKHCLALSCGTHGLHLALKLLNVSQGDHIITTPITCTATNWPIFYERAHPIWSEINKDFNISSEDIENKIKTWASKGKKPKAIIIMHWGGYPCDLEKIRSISLDYDIPIIEDAAHAYGSMYENSKIGSCKYSDFTMFSFQAIKILTCVDGGALFLNNAERYKRGKLLRWYGIDREGPRIDLRCEAPIPEIGFKYHMNDVCATIGLGNMNFAEEVISRNRENASYYDEELKNFSGIELTQTSKFKKSSYWLYTFLVEDRTGFARKMGEKGIMVSRVHERNDIHPCTSLYKVSLPITDKIVSKMISIPVGWWLSKEDREFIVSSIKAGW
jgi:dTDP-4-amino-4,6-dideoxygalactose transaminase